MVSNHLSDMLSKLSLDSENEDRLTFYLSILRRKGKSSYFISKSAGFIFDIQSKKWIYLELKKIENNFYWGCNSCQNLKTFRIMTSFDNLEQEYCVHAQAATMLWNTAEMNKKYVEDPGNVEVVSEDPFYAVVHAGDVPAVIHFPRQTKSPNCSEHPGSHKAKKSRCQHLSVYHEELSKTSSKRLTRGATSSQVQTLQNAPRKSDIKSKSEKRVPNPYEIRIPFLPDENFKEKFRAINRNGNPFPDNLIPDPQDKRCKDHKNKFCSKQSALSRYLVVAERVNIHDMFDVDDGRNTVCRVFYLDTLQDGGDDPLCGCRLPYTGETDHILPISKTGKDQTFHVVSYRILLDFFLLEVTDGTSESGYIKAHNRKQRMIYGKDAKECPKWVWLLAVSDFEHALSTDKLKHSVVQTVHLQAVLEMAWMKSTLGMG